MTLVTIPRSLARAMLASGGIVHSAGRGAPGPRNRGTVLVALAFALSVLGQGAAAFTAAHVAAIQEAPGEAQNATFTISPGSKRVAGDSWEPGAAITITHDTSHMDVGDLAADEYGNFWFGIPDLELVEPGDTITVSDGTTTKTTTVVAISVDAIVGNEVTGSAEEGRIGLVVWEDNVNRTVDVVSGHWTVDVSIPGDEDGEQETTALHPGSDGSVWQADADGDATTVDWFVRNPQFTVNADGDWIQGDQFAPGSAISITINGDPAGGEPVNADEFGWFWWDTEFDGAPDISIGDVILVADGEVSKNTVVTGLRVEQITTTTVSGWAETSQVSLSVWDKDVNRNAVAADHLWSINVSVPGDEDWEQATTTLGPGSGGSVSEGDEDGDATLVDWQVPNPRITAELTYNGVNGEDFGGPVVVTITDPTTAATETWSGSLISYEDGRFWLSLDEVAGDQEPWRLAPGQVVTVESASATKTLTLPDLAISAWDLDANTLAGTTNDTGLIVAEVGHEDNGASIEVMPAGGAWLVDFDDADPPYDVGMFDEGRATQFDADGDGTVVTTGSMGPPRFAVGPILQEIVGSDWPDGSTVTLRIDRPSEPGEVDFSAHEEAGSGCDAQDTCFSGNMPVTGDPNTYFNLTTGSFWVMAGDTVTMSDGTTTKTQLIPDIEVGLGEDDVNIVDEDGDSTYIQAPAPHVQLEPATDRVWAGNFAKGPVTITIERPEGTIVHTQTVQTQNVLTRGSWNIDMWLQPIGNLDRPTMALFDLGAFDLQAGDIVNVTDGESSETSVVARLTVESISADTDIVSGHATGTVELHLGEGEGGYWGYAVSPDGDGAWSITFTAGVWPNPPHGLTPGMTGQAIIRNEGGADTVVRWTVPESDPGPDDSTVVIADNQTVTYGAGLPELTWAASDGDVAWTNEPVCTTDATVGSPVGTYPIRCTGGVAQGYAVEYVDGTLEITPAALVISATDATRDYGAANPTLEYSVDSLADGDALATPPTCTTTATPSSPVGTYPISCSGAADDNYEISYAEGTLTVAQAAQTIDFGPIPDQVIGAPPLILVATSSSGLPVTLASTTTSVCRFAPWKPNRLTIVAIGTCTVVASQAGSASYFAAESVSWTFAVTAMPSTTTLTSNRATSVVGQPVKLTAKVTGASGTPAGSVTFMDGTAVLGTRALVRGSASLTVSSLGVGLHDISAVYGGSSAYEGSIGVLAGGVTVAQAATDVRITNAQWLAFWPTRVGASYEVKVRVVAVAPGSGFPTGNVLVTDGTVSCTFTLNAGGSGACSLTSTSVGTKTLTVAYQGSPSYLVDTATVIHVIRR